MTPDELISDLESQGYTKSIESGGGKSGPATILTEPQTGTKVRIHLEPSNGQPYFRVQNAGGNYLGTDGLFPSNAGKDMIQELTHFIFGRGN